MKQPTKDAAVLQRVRADLASAFEEVDRLAAEKRELESQLAARFVEVAALTRIATRAEDERDAAVEALNTEVTRLRAAMDGMRQAAARRYQAAILAVVDAAPWRWLPGRLRAFALSPLLRRTGLLDENWYASQYEDVAAGGHDPVRHFIAYGAKEGRSSNQDAVLTNGPEPTKTGQ